MKKRTTKAMTMKISMELPSTKDGYAKDGFVVADDDEDEFSEYGCESDDEYCFTDED